MICGQNILAAPCLVTWDVLVHSGGQGLQNPGESGRHRPQRCCQTDQTAGEAAAHVQVATYGERPKAVAVVYGRLSQLPVHQSGRTAPAMKTTITCILAAICSCLTYAQKPDSKTAPWPMFQRPDVVTLSGKEIPDAYKRTKITDSQGRVLVGEWLSIDTKTQKVKFRRSSDGEEFDIAFASLSTEDRFYAELETGSQWDLGEAAKRFPHPFDPKEPLFKNRSIAPSGVVYAAFNSLLNTYTPEEVLRHLQARTLTSSFVYEYDNEWRGNYGREDTKMYFGSAAHARNLAEIVPTLSLSEQDGNVSLKARIDKFGLALYEERSPKEPKEYALEDYAGQLPQAAHFVAQYIRLSNGKEKLPYMTLIQANTRGYATPFHNEAKENIYTALEKAHQVKVWWHPKVLYYVNEDRSDSEEFHRMMMQLLTRQHIRNNKPVVVTLVRPNWPGDDYVPPADAKEGYAVIIGYSLENGKATYETLVLYGPTYPGSMNLQPSPTPEYKAKLDSNYFLWRTALFIE
jgi:hypothetical protein